MFLKELELENFRNYESEKIEFCRGLNIICGKNAQGKTNILEAVYLFSVGKSHRTYHDNELVKFGADKSKIKIVFDFSERECNAEIEIFKNKRKIISVNDILIKKNSLLIGKFNVVYFGPEYLSLVQGGPKLRRRNLDILISQLRPNYFSFVTDLKRIVESKNALLKGNNVNMTMLEILNERLSSVSAEIIKYRFEFISRIEKIANKIQSEISGGTENLKMNYISSVGGVESLSKEEIKEALKDKLKSNEKREIEQKECLVGPQREDVEFLINDLNAKLYASQGQQKTVALVHKISEVELINEEIGEYPVLLLDDIMSELDKKRQKYILENIKNMQIILTCTDSQMFRKKEDKKIIRVENGKIKR